MPREALVSREHEGNGPSEFDSSIMPRQTHGFHRCDLARARKARASRGQKKHPCCAAPRGKVKHNTRTGGSALEVRAVKREALYFISVFNRACRRGTGRRGIGRRCSGWHAELLKKLDVPHAGEAGSRASVSTATRKRNTAAAARARVADRPCDRHWLGGTGRAGG
jgi:hypothetical protein